HNSDHSSLITNRFGLNLYREVKLWGGGVIGSLMPNIGQVITLQVAAVDEQEASRRLKSRIANEQGQEFWIETPIDEGGRMRALHEGDALSISYMSAGATFYFNT